MRHCSKAELLPMTYDPAGPRKWRRSTGVFESAWSPPAQAMAPRERGAGRNVSGNGPVAPPSRRYLPSTRCRKRSTSARPMVSACVRVFARGAYGTPPISPAREGAAHPPRQIKLREVCVSCPQIPMIIAFLSLLFRESRYAAPAVQG
jgi:hypothetical protein